MKLFNGLIERLRIRKHAIHGRCRARVPVREWLIKVQTIEHAIESRHSIDAPISNYGAVNIDHSRIITDVTIGRISKFRAIIKEFMVWKKYTADEKSGGTRIIPYSNTKMALSAVERILYISTIP